MTAVSEKIYSVDVKFYLEVWRAGEIDFSRIHWAEAQLCDWIVRRSIPLLIACAQLLQPQNSNSSSCSFNSFWFRNLTWLRRLPAWNFPSLLQLAQVSTLLMRRAFNWVKPSGSFIGKQSSYASLIVTSDKCPSFSNAISTHGSCSRRAVACLAVIFPLGVF